MPLGRIFARDDCLWAIVDGLAEHLEMLVLDYAGVGHTALCVVHNGVTLIIWFVDDFMLETNGSVVELSEAVIVKLVYLSRKDYLVGQAFPIAPVIKEIGICSCLDTIEQAVDKFVVTTDGDALVFVVEVVVVKREAHGQTLDDERRQLAARKRPILTYPCLSGDTSKIRLKFG